MLERTKFRLLNKKANSLFLNMATSDFPPKDLALSNLAVKGTLAVKNLTVSGTLTVGDFNVVPSSFPVITPSVSSFQTSGGSVGNIVSLQVAFSITAPLLLVPGNSLLVATVATAQIPLGNVTGVAFVIDSNPPPGSPPHIQGTFLLTSVGDLYLYATTTDIALGATPLTPASVTGSLSYIV